MENSKLKFQWLSYFAFILCIIPKHIITLKPINAQGCFDTLMKNDTPLCTFEMSEGAHDIGINCVRPGVLQIVGDYEAVYINCSASYPLDFKFDGHKPTEAIETLSWAMVEKNSGGKFKSHHLDVKIFSIPFLHDHYVALYPEKKITHRDSYNYSRTGSYIFSGYNEQEHFQSKFYIFFEEKSALRSFLRNKDVVINLPNLSTKIQEHLPLVIPCRPSHFNANVTIEQAGGVYFKYDPVVGFSSIESWKAIIESNPNLNYNATDFTCFFNQTNDLILFSTKNQVWYTVRANGSVVEEVIDYDLKENYFSYAKIHLTADVRKILVAASIYFKPEWRNFTMDIKFEKSIKPTFDDIQIPFQKFNANSNQILKCTATGVPQPDIYWQRNNKNISSGVSFVDRTSILEFTNIQENDAGEYVCVAANVASAEKKIFTVQVFYETDLGMIIGLSVSICICGALAIIASWVYFKLLRTGKAALSKSEIDNFLNGEHDQNNVVEGNSNSNEYVHDLTHLRPYNTELEIAEKRFHIDLSRVLGSGAYGMVVMGTLDGVQVAVKTVKRNADKFYLKALLSELKVMSFLGDHENIVGLLGANTVNLKRGQVFIFVPFCSLGSLQEHLRNNRRSFRQESNIYMNQTAVRNASSEVFKSNPSVCEDAYTNINQDSISTAEDNSPEYMMTTKGLYQWATQIAQGMKYLSSKKVLHGDLAARNVVLTEKRVAKITDFGLSRRLYDYSEYAKTQQEPLPWRWLSMESLRDLTFSTKSDAWSYGITLWEIFSLGQVPYPGYSWTMDFVKELESGMRMSCPQFASEELYNVVMKECWQADPMLRPSFVEIQDYLSDHSKF